jgi:hypothetical protein
VEIPRRAFCDSSGQTPFPPLGESTNSRLSCEVAAGDFAALIVVENEENDDGTKRVAATMTQAPGGVAGSAAVYGLDTTGFVVCQAQATVASGRQFADCPSSVINYLGRIETEAE